MINKSIFENTKYLYAEMMKGKAVTLTIKEVVESDIVGENGRKDKGHEMRFKETPKVHAFTCMTTRRALTTIMGTDDYTTWAGKKVTLYPVEVKVRGQVVQAIRYRAPALANAAPMATKQTPEETANDAAVDAAM